MASNIEKQSAPAREPGRSRLSPGRALRVVLDLTQVTVHLRQAGVHLLKQLGDVLQQLESGLISERLIRVVRRKSTPGTGCANVSHRNVPFRRGFRALTLPAGFHSYTGYATRADQLEAA